MTTETNTVPGGRFDPLYNVLKSEDNRDEIENRRESRKIRIGSGGIKETKTKQKRENATTLISSRSSITSSH